MSKINSQHATWFIVGFAFLSLFTNIRQNRAWLQPAQASVSPVAQQAQLEQQQQAAQHAAYLSRYLNGGMARKPGAQILAIMVASEDGKPNVAVNNALAKHFKTGTVETVPSFFTPEFVADGLLADAFNDSTSVFKNLDVARSLDAVVLARQTVQYSKDPAMENLVSATMQLEVMLAPTAVQSQPQSWTFTAYGAGFDQKAARALAEERLINQIAKDTKMSF